MTVPQTTSASYEVGYGKPPRHTQFKKGQSGNPGGRPRGRLQELALREAYRTVVVREDGRAVPVPAIQAVLRSQIELASSGNVRAQRAILTMIRDIEQEAGPDLCEPGNDGDAGDGDAGDGGAGNCGDADDAGDCDEASGSGDAGVAGGVDDDPAQEADGEIDTDDDARQEERARDWAAAPPPIERWRQPPSPEPPPPPVVRWRDRPQRPESYLQPGRRERGGRERW